MYINITNTETGDVSKVNIGTVTFYRLYADGSVVHQDDFDEIDMSLPYYDDYGTHMVPDDLDYYAIGTSDYPLEIKEALYDQINELGDI